MFSGKKQRMVKIATNGASIRVSTISHMEDVKLAEICPRYRRRQNQANAQNSRRRNKAAVWKRVLHR